MERVSFAELSAVFPVFRNSERAKSALLPKADISGLRASTGVFENEGVYLMKIATVSRNWEMEIGLAI